MPDQLGTIWLESGKIENAVFSISDNGIVFHTYDGLKVLSLTGRELQTIFDEWERDKQEVDEPPIQKNSRRQKRKNSAD